MDKIEFQKEGWVENDPIRCKESIDKEFKVGWYYGSAMINRELWAVVLWDIHVNPELYKADMLLFEKQIWVSLEDWRDHAK